MPRLPEAWQAGLGSWRGSGTGGHNPSARLAHLACALMPPLPRRPPPFPCHSARAACASRLCFRPQFNSLTRLSRALVPRAANTLRRAKSTTTSNLSYSERMDKTGRPISPHVIPSWAPMAGVPQETRGFVYALPAIAWSSLTMRFTGMALWGGAVGFGALAVIDPSAPASMASSIAGSA